MAKNRRGTTPRVSLTFLGGLGEIGKNMTALECNGDILIIEAGLVFPDDETPGVDIILPDTSALADKRDRVRGIVLTHGHEDHVGALPYVLRDFDVPVFATRLTLGMVERRLAESNQQLPAGSRALAPRERQRLGCLEFEFFRVNHSIPDSVGVAVRTPAGLVVHTGDFKFDLTPVDGQVADFHKLAEYGEEGVLVLLSDSTNADRPGHTPSERVVGSKLHEIMSDAPGRVLLATFASNIHRIKQVIDAAVAHDRVVAVLGRSMEGNVEVARGLGYLTIPDGLLVRPEDLQRFPPRRTVLLTTGSQGEPMSALARIASGEHRRISVLPDDTVILAATPIPGNEKLVARTVDQLFRRGAHVIYEREAGVHVSGHASREEQKLMLNLLRPRFFVPIHGQYRHLYRHAELAAEVGIPSERIFVADNGTVLEFEAERGAVAGRVQAGAVMVDGLGVGDVGSVVLRDRRQLAQDGILICVVAVAREDGAIVSGPEIDSRGFVFVRESEALLEEARQRVRDALLAANGAANGEVRRGDWNALKSRMRDSLGRHLYDRTGRRPMILPIVVEV